MNTASSIHYSYIHQKYGQRIVLLDIHLTLNQGEVHFLSGKNGSGKTSLLRIMSGLEKPSSCQINMGYGEVSWKQCRAKLLKQVMYLHQAPYMFEGTVFDNLALALSNQLPRREKASRIGEALEWARLTQLSNEDAKTLSGGEKQRIALARAWLRRSKILLLDEPIANMDEESSKRTIELLQSLKMQKVTLMITSHRPSDFSSIIDSHHVLHEGQIRPYETMIQDSKVQPIINPISKANG